MAFEFEMIEAFDVPVEKVFRTATDLDAMGKWMPNFVGIEQVSGNGFEVGARWRQTRKMFGRDATEEFEVTGVEPGRSFELFVDGTKGSSGKGEFRFRYDFEPENGGTRLRLSGSIEGAGLLMSILGRVFSGFFRKALRKDLDAMMEYIRRSERDAGGA